MTAHARIDGADGAQISLPGFGGTMLAPVLGGEAPVFSPAQRLQDALEREFAEPLAQKWPPIIGMGFVAASGGLFWTLAVLAIKAV